MSAKSPPLRVGLLACWISLLVGLLPFTAAGQGRLDKTGWQLDSRLSEDFDEGTTLATLVRHWHFDLQGGPVFNTSSTAPSFEPYITPNNIAVADGYAYMSTRRLPTPHHEVNTDRDYSYSTACLRSRLDEFPDINPAGDTVPGGVLYGMFEIRCKLPGKPGQYPSLWLIADNGQAEIDLFEFNATHPTQFFSTVHWDAAGTPRPKFECGNTYTFPAGYLTSGFHTWTLVWTPTRITWFFEGRELKTIDIPERIPGAATPAPNPYELCKYYKMDLIIGPGLLYPDASEASFELFVVDYIHVYRPAGLLPPENSAAPELSQYYYQTLLPAYERAAYTYKGDADGPRGAEALNPPCGTTAPGPAGLLAPPKQRPARRLFRLFRRRKPAPAPPASPNGSEPGRLGAPRR